MSEVGESIIKGALEAWKFAQGKRMFVLFMYPVILMFQRFVPVCT